MKSPDNVLLGTAILLLAGVILYNVFTVEPEPLNVTSDTTAVSSVSVTTTAAATTEAPAYTKVNINTATAEELETLKGIGPAKARAIVAYRDANGPFSSVEELTNVSGIGEKTLANIIDDITV